MYVLEYRNRSTNIYRPVFFGLYAFILFDMFESSVGVQSSVRSVRAPPAGRGWNCSHMLTKTRRSNVCQQN